MFKTPQFSRFSNIPINWKSAESQPEVNSRCIKNNLEIVGVDKQVPCGWCGCECEPLSRFSYMYDTLIMNYNF